jgi:hypothetical protein
MFLSAAIFGYFGFGVGYPETDTVTGKAIPMVLTLKWSVRGAAVAFLAAGGLTLVHPGLGNGLYAVAGLIAAALFCVVAAWDLGSTYASGIHPFLLLVFAAWNGYASFSGLRARGRARRGDGGGEP